MAFPLFLFAVYLLILPMRMMRTSMQMQQICEQTCELLAEAAYLQQLAAAGSTEAGGTEADSAGGPEKGNTDGAASLSSIASENGGSAGKRSDEADALVKWLSDQGVATLIGNAAAAAIADENVEDVFSWRSAYMTDGEIIRLTLDYQYRLPFFHLGHLHQSVTASRRAWVGRSEGGISDGQEDEEEDDEIVYVGRGDAVVERGGPLLRNAGGSRYTPCARCAKGAHPGTVYIMPSGEVWHADPDCSAISAYARAVRKSEVEHLGPCSYCCH